MPKVSSESAAHVDDHGPVEDRHEDIDGYTINFLTFRESIDGTPLFHGLPGDSCNCPHWGYVIRGRVVVRYDDHEEVLGPGDAFYMAPGHAPEAEEGTELVQFSPTEQLAEVEAAIAAATQA